MTNNWTDIGNASLVVVMGANPVENHPACMAHINKARDKGAGLVVIDPRKTRTACQVDPSRGDRYIRIRPGTDIAFLNGVIRRIIEKMEMTEDEDPTVTDARRARFYEFLNVSAAGTFFTDGDAATGSSSGTAVPGGLAKYTDSRFLVKDDGSDYERETIVASTGLPYTGTPVVAASGLISNFPKKVTDCRSDSRSVYGRLRDHVAPYLPESVAEICGCAADEVEYVAQKYIDNSRAASVAPVNSASIGTQDPAAAGYKVTTMLYAMGQTQHTYGAQNVKMFAVIQTLMGNMGRAGGGINALRGIHNVQGSTDMGNLFGNIPFYSGNPTVQTSEDANAYGKYMDNLWGLPLNGTGIRAQMNNSYDDAYKQAAMALQQWGFANMTYNFFGGGRAWATGPDSSGCVFDRTFTNGLYDLWPKGNGDDHITMFRKASTGAIKAMLVWGQNPAVTEPNQGAIRPALKELDTLVVVDMFETETAAAERKDGSVTYLIPACSHVEEAGSVTNSGRILQWRERATLPKGNSKADLEIMFRLAKAFDGKSAFTHLTDQWFALGKGTLNAYDTLYGNRYGWTTGSLEDFTLTGVDIWTGADRAPSGTFATNEVKGTEALTELMFREMATIDKGTSWLYTDAYNAASSTNRLPSGVSASWKVYNRAKSRDNTDYKSTLAFHAWGYSWLVNRRVFYNNKDVPGDQDDFYMGPDSVSRLYVTDTSLTGRALNYSRWYRFYHKLADKPDVCLTASLNAASPHFAFADASGTAVSFAGRFPAHTEPYETPSPDLADLWGRNTKNTAKWDLAKSDGQTPIVGRDAGYDAADYPFVLTTIRCVEHFQGGPITRNNPWNVEMEPEPWVEINSIDAAAKGIKTGDLVDVTTARSNSTDDQKALTITVGEAARPDFAQGFRARVGVGLESNQRVGVGVVAIPWHWGDKGLSTGSRANDLCHDAGDANTVIPEYKALLCNITKIS